ncbi:MAG: helix-turn-helix domain-containing protein [Clostridia bacterium]|nr:helix-turn-helix domain-containing protein [Clostridia bacterium]
MKERTKVHLSPSISVDAINSVFHLDLTGRQTRGELHDFYEMVYVESGFYYVLLDGVRYDVDPGSIIFFAPNTFHTGDGSFSCSATVDIISFDAEGEGMKRFENRIFPLSKEQQQLYLSLFFFARDLLEMCKGNIRIKEGTKATDLQTLKNKIELFLLGISASCQDCTGSNAPNLYRKQILCRVLEYMKQHLADRLSITQIATACAISTTALKRLFREFCDCGPIEYLISLRITAAKGMIREGGMSLGEIAERTGFDTLHYFSRVFKARVGISPSAYAKLP